MQGYPKLDRTTNHSLEIDVIEIQTRVEKKPRWHEEETPLRVGYTSSGLFRRLLEKSDFLEELNGVLVLAQADCERGYRNSADFLSTR